MTWIVVRKQHWDKYPTEAEAERRKETCQNVHPDCEWIVEEWTEEDTERVDQDED